MSEPGHATRLDAGLGSATLVIAAGVVLGLLVVTGGLAHYVHPGFTRWSR